MFIRHEDSTNFHIRKPRMSILDPNWLLAVWLKHRCFQLWTSYPIQSVSLRQKEIVVISCSIEVQWQILVLTVLALHFARHLLAHEIDMDLFNALLPS